MILTVSQSAFVCWQPPQGSTVPVWITSQLEKSISFLSENKLTWCLLVQCEGPMSLTSVPMSFILASANSLRLPCSTPELTSGMGMSLTGGKEQEETHA